MMQNIKYYVNGMVISCSTCQKEEKECIWVKYLIYTVLSKFQTCRNLRAFSAKSVIPQCSQKIVFVPSLLNGIYWSNLSKVYLVVQDMQSSPRKHHEKYLLLILVQASFDYVKVGPTPVLALCNL